MLVFHSISNHKEYRFIFAIIPLWMMIAADCCARMNKMIPKAVAVIAFIVSLLDIFNYLPYRYLSSESDISGIWLIDRISIPVAITSCTRKYLWNL